MNILQKQDQIQKLKNKIRPKYERFKRIGNQFSCGTNLMLNISSEASKLKREIDELWEQLRSVDSSCPKSWM